MHAYFARKREARGLDSGSSDVKKEQKTNIDIYAPRW
jgi:hypothetical protein